MEIEYLTNENAQMWDDFAQNSDYAWFRHTTDWFKYSKNCRFDSDSKNHSFMIKQNKEIIAIVPLMSEYSYPDKENQCFAMYSDYTPLPAIKNNCDINISSIFDAIWNEISKISKENNIKYGKFQIDPLIKFNYFRDFTPFNIFSKNIKLEFTTTNIIDLRKTEEEILRSMRKGHKAAIKQVIKEKNYRVDIFDKNNITKDKLFKFKEIHKIDAGRQTRTDKSWECMLEWIEKGKAVLVMLWLEEIKDYAAAALIMMYKNAAYYASYATIDSKILNGHHGYIIQWEAIKYLKSAGIEFYEAGANVYSSLLTNAGGGGIDILKLCAIAKYKRGFSSLEFPSFKFKVDLRQE